LETPDHAEDAWAVTKRVKHIWKIVLAGAAGYIKISYHSMGV
jgi:hypothetical protein